LRSRNIFGPYEDKIVLEQGGTSVNGPHQGALVDTPEGEWWFVHFQDAGVYGRITHLQPVKWQDGWPLMGIDEDGNGVGEPVSRHAKPAAEKKQPVSIPATSDEFDSPALGLQWQWQANHRAGWYKLDAPGSRLNLYPQLIPMDDPARAPNLLLQKFPAPAFKVETLLEFVPGEWGEEAGLVIMGESHATLGLHHNGLGNQIVLRINGVQKFLCDNLPNAVKLGVEVTDGGLCRFIFSSDGNSVKVPQTFQARKGVWIGAKVGLYSFRRLKNAPSGQAGFDYFRFLQVE
jgi:beta-xylosidase